MPDEDLQHPPAPGSPAWRPPTHARVQGTGASREDTLSGARRLRAFIEHAERAAAYDPDPTRRASAEQWLEALTDPACVPPFPPALAPRTAS